MATPKNDTTKGAKMSEKAVVRHGVTDSDRIASIYAKLEAMETFNKAFKTPKGYRFITTTNNNDNNTLSSSELVKKGFRFAPPEVREMIFKYAFRQSTKLSVMREVFRGDPELLGEAEAAYGKTIVPKIYFRQDNSFEEMMPLQVLQRLRINVVCIYSRPGLFLQKLFAEAINLRDLSLIVPLFLSETAQAMFKKIAKCIGGFSKLRKVSIEIINIRPILTDKFTVHKLVGAVNTGFGIENIQHPASEIYMWNASPGMVLVWNPQD